MMDLDGTLALPLAVGTICIGVVERCHSHHKQQNGDHCWNPVRSLTLPKHQARERVKYDRNDQPGQTPCWNWVSSSRMLDFAKGHHWPLDEFFWDTRMGLSAKTLQVNPACGN